MKNVPGFNFILDTMRRIDDIDEMHERFEKYYDYLKSIKDKLPERVYKFAIADWHYDPECHECPHDSWVEHLLIEEPSSGKRNEKRNIDIKVKLLGSYHDGHIELTYENVFGYQLGGCPEETWHGDWLIDEVRLSEKGNVIHEIEFRNDYRWLIECKDITYEWKPLKK